MLIKGLPSDGYFSSFMKWLYRLNRNGPFKVNQVHDNIDYCTLRALNAITFGNMRRTGVQWSEIGNFIWKFHLEISIGNCNGYKVQIFQESQNIWLNLLLGFDIGIPIVNVKSKRKISTKFVTFFENLNTVKSWPVNCLG